MAKITDNFIPSIFDGHALSMEDVKKDDKMAKNKVKENKKAEIEQKVEVYWKEYNDKTLLAIKVIKGSKTTVILKDPSYLKELRDHLQTVAKFGLRRNII